MFSWDGARGVMRSALQLLFLVCKILQQLHALSTPETAALSTSMLRLLCAPACGDGGIMSSKAEETTASAVCSERSVKAQHDCAEAADQLNLLLGKQTLAMQSSVMVSVVFANHGCICPNTEHIHRGRNPMFAVLAIWTWWSTSDPT